MDLDSERTDIGAGNYSSNVMAAIIGGKQRLGLSTREAWTQKRRLRRQDPRSPVSRAREHDNRRWIASVRCVTRADRTGCGQRLRGQRLRGQRSV